MKTAYLIIEAKGKNNKILKCHGVFFEKQLAHNICTHLINNINNLSTTVYWHEIEVDNGQITLKDIDKQLELIRKYRVAY